MIKHYNIIHRY